MIASPQLQLQPQPLQHPKCPKGHIAESVCINEKCDHHAFCCKEVNCCQKILKSKCKIVKVQDLLRIYQNSSERLSAIYKNTVDFFQNLRKIVESQLKNYKEWSERLLSGQAEVITAEQMSKIKAQIQQFNDEYFQDITAYQNHWQKTFREQFTQMRTILCQRGHSQKKLSSQPRSTGKLLNEQYNKNISLSLSLTTRIVWKQSEKEYLFQILKYLKNVQSVNLLFHAGSHDFSIAKFHELCDGIPNTLVIVRNQKEKVYGGFSTIPWGSSKYQQFLSDDSLKTFTFSLTNKKKYLLRQQQKQHAIEWNRMFGPLFGRCNMIQVWDKSNKESKYWSYLPQSFKPTHGQWTNQMYEQMLGVKRYQEYRLLDWEVFEVIFN